MEQAEFGESLLRDKNCDGLLGLAGDFLCFYNFVVVFASFLVHFFSTFLLSSKVEGDMFVTKFDFSLINNAQARSAMDQHGCIHRIYSVDFVA